MRRFFGFFVLLLGTGCMIPAFGQYTDLGVEVGIHGGATYDLSSGIEEPKRGGILGGLDFAWPLFPALQMELSGSYAELVATNELSLEDIRTQIVPVDLKFKLAPFGSPKVIPYLFAGAGAIRYNHDEMPKAPGAVASSTEETGWIFYAPGGIGLQLGLSSHVAFDMRATFNYVGSPDLTPDPDDDNDMFASAQAGLRFSVGSSDPDTDGDGLLNREEKRIGTDPKNRDTDGDGLEDGEEHVHLRTNPLVVDTDEDGLSDFDEVRMLHTNPLKADTDDDGLRDGEEKDYHTDPLKADTDADGLGDATEVHDTHTDPTKADSDEDGLDDGVEINQYRTDPLKHDTDGDGLTDGAEVNQHRTDPLKMDTDGGTIADGLEIERGSNPLDPADDVPVIVFELEKPVVLEGINFAYNSAEILPESEKILNQALESMKAHTEIVVEIGGHTDSKGSNAYNQKLSERRANSVRDWMVNHGIDASRLIAVGYGETKPIATNDTEDGRLRNRRIEFKRIK